MRPCDDTFGLVRGNRRKAVFAFRGAVSEGHLSEFASGQWVFYCVFRKCGENRNLLNAPRFLPIKPTQGLKSGIWPAGLGFSPHFRMHAKYGFNVLGLESHIKLPIGYKTNIVSIMLTKGWL